MADRNIRTPQTTPHPNHPAMIFQERRKAKLQHKIEQMERKKALKFIDFQAANKSNDLDATLETWSHLVEIGRQLGKLKRTMTKMEVRG